MISYNDADAAWTQRVHKEIWTKDELRDFGARVSTDKIRNQFGIAQPESQDEIEFTKHNR